MPTVHLVRHGRAAAGYDRHRDPGLDAVGRAQAEAVAEALAGAFEAPAPIYTSPLARARETAAPLAERWRVEPIVEPRVAEIPAPTTNLEERGHWLRGVMGAGLADLPAQAAAWRRDAIECVLAFERDVVVFCHFIVINVVVGAALDAEALIVFRPDNASVTRVGTDGGELALLSQGREGQTRVN